MEKFRTSDLLSQHVWFGVLVFQFGFVVLISKNYYYLYMCTNDGSDAVPWCAHGGQRTASRRGLLLFLQVCCVFKLPLILQQKCWDHRCVHCISLHTQAQGLSFGHRNCMAIIFISQASLPRLGYLFYLRKAFPLIHHVA